MLTKAKQQIQAKTNLEVGILSPNPFNRSAEPHNHFSKSQMRGVVSLIS